MAAGDMLDGLNPGEVARVLAITGVAVIRRGELTTRQIRAIDGIVTKAAKRREKKENAR